MSKDIQTLIQRAYDAAREAHKNAKPVPMRVVQHSNPLDDASPIVRDYGVIEDGVCGFAWVNIRPGNSTLARYLVKNRMARKSYYGGVDVSMSMFGSQSLERADAAARAFAKVLSDAGYSRVYAQSRID